jgi:hypothetical protein
VLGGGSGIGGFHDQFEFFSKTRSGDFDVRVRVATAEVTDPSFLAGILARESLATDSPFAGVFASSPQLGTVFSGRSAAGLPAFRRGGVPVNYPHTWLRLRRVGNSFTGFAGFDGTSWIALGTSEIAMPAIVHFGMAVASRHPSQATAAQFRSLGNAPSPVEVPRSDWGESPGPSSPFTGLVFSEIQYHPAGRTDGRNLEFIEIYNAGDLMEDMSGMKLSGDADFTFPPGTSLQAGTFLIVAASPSDLLAVQPGLPRVLGPYTGSLPNDRGQLRLRNELNAIMLEVNYSDRAPWPVVADGTGHSLSLARPSYGEDDPRAWTGSVAMGGSPGGWEPLGTGTTPEVVINEFLAHASGSIAPFVEFYNRGSRAVNLAGYSLSSGPGDIPVVIRGPASVPAGGFLRLNLSALGLSLDPSGDWIVLIHPNQTRVIDAVRFDGQEINVASGRFPDGDRSIRRLRSPTPAAANSRLRLSSVVINELMYNPLSNNSDDEYVELHNTSKTSPIDVSGWRLLDGITYTVPAGTVIPTNSFLVVAKNKARMLAAHSHLNAGNTVGNFSGSLRNSGERVALAFPATATLPDGAGGTIVRSYLVVESEVGYVDGGRWPADADGGGSSLELKDPRADTLQPSSWAASDETGKADWTPIEVTGVLDLGNDSFPPDQLQITLQGEGECLIDDIEVIRNGEPNFVSNGTLEAGDAGWVYQGNHVRSGAEASVGWNGSTALHLRTTGRGDTGANRIFAPLTSVLTPGDTVTLRAKVRWLRGWPEVLVRLRGSWLELAGRMDVPVKLGTPGRINSRWIPNAGPAIYDVTQSPVLPADGQPVVITARLNDPDAIFSVILQYRRDPDTTFSSVRMSDDGRNGDARALDGVFSATLPGEPTGTLVAWKILATDLISNRVNPLRASSIYPDGIHSQEALVRWGEPEPTGTFGHYHFWITQSDYDAWMAGGGLNNLPRPVTLVYGRNRLIHGASVRHKGSPFHGGSGDFVFDIPKDSMVLGENDLLLAAPGNQGNDDAKQREQIAFWILRKMGAPYLHRRFVSTFLNGARQYDVMEQAQEPNGSIAEAWFNEVNSGDLYKIEDWFEFTDDFRGFSSRDATLERFTTTGDVLKPARYRWSWRKRAVENSANDFSNLFALVEAANAPAETYISELLALADIDEWMRVFALQRIVGNWDSYGFARGKNSYLYKRETGPSRIFAWDIDFVLGSGSNGPTDWLWGSNDPVINRMYDTPAFRRLLWAAYRDAVNGPLRADQVTPQMDARYAALVANDVPTAGPQSTLGYIQARREFILEQLNAVDSALFAITTNDGNDISTDETTITLTGLAPFAVHAIRNNRASLPIVWLNDQQWQITVPLTERVNVLQLTGYDRQGNPVPGATDSITVTTTDAQPAPGSGLVISEIMYQPLPAGSGGNLFEFIELHNSGTRSLNLAGAAFTEGISFTFPDGTVLGPGQYLVLARDSASFAQRHPGAIAQGIYSGQLDNGGETLTLTGAGGNPIVSFAYDDAAPWPTSPDGTGPSLQRIRLAPDSSNGPENWGAGPATPGGPFVVSPSLASASGSALAANRKNVKLAASRSSTDGTEDSATAGLDSVRPRIVAVLPASDGSIRIRGQGTPSTPYRLRAASQLSDATTWIDLGSAWSDPEGHVQFLEKDGGTFAFRFYQILSQP